MLFVEFQNKMITFYVYTWLFCFNFFFAIRVFLVFHSENDYRFSYTYRLMNKYKMSGDSPTPQFVYLLTV